MALDWPSSACGSSNLALLDGDGDTVICADIIVGRRNLLLFDTSVSLDEVDCIVVC